MELVIIFGPPAVGKMTVGMALAELTGLRLFHNHMAIEPVLPLFDFGTPAFVRLVQAFRDNVFQEVANSDLPGLIFTYMWALDLPEDRAAVDRLTGIFAARNARVSYVELSAAIAVRLVRNATPLRLAHKPSKRDIASSRARMLGSDNRYQLNSDGNFPYADRHLHIETEQFTAQEVATRIAGHFNLPRAPAR